MINPYLSTPSGKPHARALGAALDGVPGRLNATTDVAGVEVGYRTPVSGEGSLVVPRGLVCTGVTAILRRGPVRDLLRQYGRLFR